MSLSDDALQRLTKAKSRLVMNHPFFASLALGLPLVEADWLQPPTMATDMTQIFYHPKFVEECTVSELMGVLCHEVLHVAYLHGLRRGPRDHKIWNMACDFAINPIVLDAGMMLPQGGLYDDKYRNLSAPEIYEDLMKNATIIKVACDWGGVTEPKKGQGQGQGDGQGEDQGKSLSQSQLSELEQEIKIKVKAAAETAKARGKLPAGVEGLIDAIGKPKVDWKAYIQQWVSGHKPDDYTWARPNRTWLVNHGVYMPRMQMNGAGVGVLSIDTSGSVSDKELVDYITEIAGVIEICNPDKLYIVQHDAVIQRVDVWEHGMDFKGLKVKGRGGTNIQPTFKWIDDCDEHVDWMICFTDMGICDYPSKKDAPDIPVLWCATGPDNAPFGTYIPLKDAI